MKAANSILSGYGTTVFEVMSRLAMEHKAINLGQGFPDEDGPQDVRQLAADQLLSGLNQYPPMMGIPDLRQAVAGHNKRFYNIDVDWQTEIMVTSGATEALADCMMALIEPGDEVVMIEPLYDCYLPLVRRAGGIPKLIRVTPPDWKLPASQLEDAFSDKTKLILLNSPMNPAAKVFKREELQLIADMLIKYDAYAICDEVYEHIVFEGTHIPLMTLPDMHERCIRLGSAGKSFSLTGWKVGYVTASAKLLAPIAKCHQFVTFTTPPNLQQAVAFGLRKGDDYYENLSEEMRDKRDFITKGLQEIGFDVVNCEGTYFVTADFRPLDFEGDDVRFCEYLTTKIGVAAVPVSAFYKQDGPTNFVRFCFCKKYEVLEEALKRLSKISKNKDHL